MAGEFSLAGAKVHAGFVAFDMLSLQNNLYIAFKLHGFVFAVTKHAVGIQKHALDFCSRLRVRPDREKHSQEKKKACEEVPLHRRCCLHKPNSRGQKDECRGYF